MNRVKKFKMNRQAKRRCAMVIILTLLIGIFGIIYADYSISSLMRDKGKIMIFSFNKKKDLYIKINILGNAFYVNTYYIAKDISSIKHGIQRFLGGILN